MDSLASMFRPAGGYTAADIAAIRTEASFVSNYDTPTHVGFDRGGAAGQVTFGQLSGRSRPSNEDRAAVAKLQDQGVVPKVKDGGIWGAVKDIAVNFVLPAVGGYIAGPYIGAGLSAATGTAAAGTAATAAPATTAGAAALGGGSGTVGGTIAPGAATGVAGSAGYSATATGAGGIWGTATEAAKTAAGAVKVAGQVVSIASSTKTIVDSLTGKHKEITNSETVPPGWVVQDAAAPAPATTTIENQAPTIPWLPILVVVGAAMLMRR